MMQAVRAIITVFLLAIAAAFIQGTFLKSVLPYTSVAPNFMITVVVFLSFYEATAYGVFLSFLAGLLLDFFSGILIGPWAGAFVLCFGLLSLISQRVFVESALTTFLAVFGSSLIAQFCYVALHVQFRPADTAPVTLSVRILLEALLSAFFAPLIFMVLKRLKIVRPARVI